MQRVSALTIGPSADAVRAAGKELCDLIACMTANHCCERVQLAAIKSFKHICEVKDFTVRDCKFFVGHPEPTEPVQPNSTQVDHGTGNY